METEESRVKAREAPDVLARYQKIKAIGKEVFADSEVVQTGIVTSSDVLKARGFLGEAALATNPPVWASFWEHTLIAPEMGKQIADEVSHEKPGLINPLEIEFLLWLHEMGRLVTPAAYLRNDFIDQRILTDIGIPKAVLAKLPLAYQLMEEAAKLNLMPNQAAGAIPLSEEQQQICNQYFARLTPAQRIINLADNLGKRDEKGLFDLKSFLHYLRTQEGRYKSSPWPSVTYAESTPKGKFVSRRRSGAFLQAFVIEKTVDWLSEMEIDFETIRNGLLDYGPKFVLVVRHGELDNPRRIVYNRDPDMAKENIMHLSKEGSEQTRLSSEEIKKRGFRPVILRTSPETRTCESAQIISTTLGIEIEKDKNLDDVYAPGPYRRNLTMDNLQEIGGNVYDQSIWGEYNHETPEEVVKRMSTVFWEVTNKLTIGQTGILISHGDPIAWLANFLNCGKIPEPEELRKLIYPPKGAAVVAVIDPKGTLFTQYLMAGYDLSLGKLY